MVKTGAVPGLWVVDQIVGGVGRVGRIGRTGLNGLVGRTGRLVVVIKNGGADGEVTAVAVTNGLTEVIAVAWVVVGRIPAVGVDVEDVVRRTVATEMGATVVV